MDSRFDLVRRAQAGDAGAVHTLIERNQGVIYRLVLALLDDPDEAVEAVKETFHKALGQLEEYGGNVAFSTWLYPIAVDNCRQRLRRRQVVARIPVALRKLLRLAERAPARGQVKEAPGSQGAGLMQAVQQLEDRLRLPFILRYDQGLTVHEMAPMLGLNESRVHKRLKAARRSVRAAVGEDAPLLEEDAPGLSDKLSHRKALEFVEDAADHLITDTHAEMLRLHLKDCEACQEASRKLDAFQTNIHTAFEKRWEDHSLPAAGFSTAVGDLRHLRRAGRRVSSLLGAGVITVMTVAMIAFLPGLTPLEAMPLPATATPTAQARQRPRTPVRPSPAANNPDPNLLKMIYPGRLAFFNKKTSGNHLYSMQPNGSDLQQLTDGISADSSPAWSPDGRRIAYLSIPDTWGANEVNVIDADGENMRTLSLYDFPKYSAPSFDWPDSQVIHYPLYGPPHWSPDGKWIAATVWINLDKSYLALLSPEGGPARYLHANNIDRWLISWSPDSRSVAYFSEGSDGLWVWQIDQPEIAGENPRRIAADTLWDIGLGLAWSPNSDRIAAMVGVLKNATIDVSLMIYDQDGEAYRAMPISVDRAMRFPLRNAHLTWSPDGRYLAFMPVFSLLDQTNSDILIVHIARNRQQKLVEVDGLLNGYSWSPDGKWLAYTAGSEIWAASMDAFTRNQDYLVQIVASGGSGLAWQSVPLLHP
jgi:RNA polymerase sigma factor (sigma-70 family)